MRTVTASMATWYDAGKLVGEETRDLIRHVVERLPAYLEETVAAGPERMREAALAYLAQVREQDKPSSDWLSGLAAGAKTRLEDIALVAFSEEIAALAVAPASKCSTVAVPGEGGWLIGHNEDYEPHYFGKMYVLDLRVGGEPRVVSLNYPGQLPHLAGALNEHGLAITNNSLWPDAQPRLSNQVKLFRAVRERRLHEAMRRLWDPPGSLTSHYTVAGPEGEGRITLYSMEVSNPETCVPRRRWNVDPPIRYEESKEILRPFVHTNHVRGLKLKAPDPAVLAGNHSLGRCAKLECLLRRERRLAEKAGKRLAADDLMRLLSTNDGLVHRTPEQDATSVTLATLIISPERKTFRVRLYAADGGHEDQTFTL